MTEENKQTLGLGELFALVKEKINAKENGSYSYELAKGGAEKPREKLGKKQWKLWWQLLCMKKNKINKPVTI